MKPNNNSRSLIITNLVLAVLVFIVSNLYAQNKPKVNIQNTFISSGWMDDGEYGRKYIDFDEACETNPKTAPDCIKIKYIYGPKHCAGIYWQNEPNNWGGERGNDYSKMGLTKVSFWARGETGSEVVEFKTGGINKVQKKYHDSFRGSTGKIHLTKEWKQYFIDISTADLSSVIGGFCWAASIDNNKNKKSITFYIDDIYFE
jgi:hypothetical protein